MKLLARLTQFIDLRDVLVFGGLACASYGIGQIHQAAAYVFAGVTLAWLGIRQ
ncbi:MAG: hypothetical protein ACOYNZ_08485 [Rhodoferax sp.]